MSNPGDRVAAAPVAAKDCGMAHAAELLGDKWTLLILREAFYGVARFEDLKADMSVSSATLSTRVQALCDAGILTKRPYREGKERTRYEYRLTERGLALAPAFVALLQWADTHLEKAPSPVQLVEASTDTPLTLELVSAKGRIVAPEHAELRII